MDCAIAEAVPAVLPLLVVGLTDFDNRIVSCSSARAAEKAVPIMQNPHQIYGSIFGSVATGNGQRAFELETELYDFIRGSAREFADALPAVERTKVGGYDEGLSAIADRRRRLAAMSASLSMHAPDLGDILGRKQPGIRAWEANVATAIGALKAGVTNVVTMTAGLCSADVGDWSGLNIEKRGHEFGHTDQMTNPDWLTLRRYNMQLLAQMIESLKSEAEGDGTMMDNTLIVYTSCHAEAHHSAGNRWPYLLIGNLGDRLRTGRHIHYPVTPKTSERRHPKVRTVNALFATILHAIGTPVDYFNLPDHLREVEKPGPLPELMA